MKIKEKDIFILQEFQRSPELSIREIARKIGFSKDSVFRAIKKFKERSLFCYDYWIDFMKVGLKPFILLVEAPYRKISSAVKSLVNPYLLDISISVGGSNLFIICKYAIPEALSFNSALGLAKSWNWHLRNYMFEARRESYNFSFHYFNPLTQLWNVQWLQWGLLIKELMIRKNISAVYPITNDWKYSPKIAGDVNNDDFFFLELFVNNCSSPLTSLAKSVDVPFMALYNKKKDVTKKGLFKKYIRLNFNKIGVTEDLCLIVETADEKVIESLIKGLQLLPITRFYKIEGDFKGLLINLSLPRGDISKLFHIFSEYLIDIVENFWFLPVIKEYIYQKLPHHTMLVNKRWVIVDLIKNKKIASLKSYVKKYGLKNFNFKIWD